MGLIFVVALLGAHAGDGRSGHPEISASDLEYEVLFRKVRRPASATSLTAQAAVVAPHALTAVRSRRPVRRAGAPVIAPLTGRVYFSNVDIYRFALGATTSTCTWDANLFTRTLRQINGRSGKDKNAMPLAFLTSLGYFLFVAFLAGFITADGSWDAACRRYVLTQGGVHEAMLRTIHTACRFYDMQPSPITCVWTLSDVTDHAGPQPDGPTMGGSTRRIASISPTPRCAQRSVWPSPRSAGAVRARCPSTREPAVTRRCSTSRRRAPSPVAASSASPSPTAAPSSPRTG